ncbi:MAG TPA: TPM domain-containing protein, partial [bacterium]|nr:TPM domain-containing protein [bacterium]
MKNRTLLLIVPLLWTGILSAQPDIPYLTGRVTDTARILSRETIQSLTETLKVHEERTGNQIAVLTISTLEGESIEDYAVKVFDAWKLGQEGEDNGLLILVVPDDRRMRIEVGYGLEPVLTDGKAGEIIHNVMTPRFKTGDYDDGIAEGVRAVITVLEGGTLSDMGRTKDGQTDSAFLEGTDLNLKERILIGAFIFGIIGLFTFIGIVTPGVGWFLYVFLIPFWALFPIVVLGSQGALYCLIVYLFGFPVAKLFLQNTTWYRKARADISKKGGASVGGFNWGSGGSGSSWSSGGFSGGGFSGGG